MERKVLQLRGVAKPLGLYSNAVEVEAGRLLFIAGQVSINERGDLVGKGDLAAQARQVFHNLGQILAEAGGSFQNVVKFTTYLVDSHDIGAFVAVRKELFAQLYPKGDYPANTLLVIARLVKEELLLEVEAIAALP